MQSALDVFRISIGRVRYLISIHNSVKVQSTGALDLSDILRAALVLAVSALDYYVHEVVKLGMLEIHRGLRPEPNFPSTATQSAFSRFQVSLGNARQDRNLAISIDTWLESEIQQSYGDTFLQQSHSIPDILTAISSSIQNRLNSVSWLENEIRERHSYQSFQQPDKIADAIRLISDKKLWDEVSTRMGKPALDIKNGLSLIVERRNKIAHEADINPPLSLGNRWYIDEAQVNDAVNFIEQLVENIHQVL